ncbi:MAG TPA: type II toxin-antitoxin system HipA family toxin [Kofleriaceae bacterium]
MTSKKPNGELIVRYEARTVGALSADRDQFGLTYDPKWLAAPDAFPVSTSLPLRSEPYAGREAHAFFANLLPEGGAREAVSRRLGLSVDNDLALLRALGGECAGAFAVVDARSRPPDPDDYAYEELGQRRLEELVDNDTVPLLLGGPPTRLSLAGAQDKLPVAVFDGVIYLPLEGAPSTHILKLPHRRFKHIPLNEAYVMGLATRIGLPTAPSELLLRTEPPSLLVQRYDRIVDGEGVRRLHQEDLCQGLGLPPTKKYEAEGGPSLATTLDFTSQHSAEPTTDLRRILGWQAFNVIVGNCDAHGKNVSFLYTSTTLRLAPFYDLLSTLQYRDLTTELAMSVGGRRTPSELHRAQWEQLAKDARIGSSLVLERVRDVAERCIAEIPAWSAEYRERYGRRSILETLPAWITKSARRTLRQLAKKRP